MKSSFASNILRLARYVKCAASYRMPSTQTPPAWAQGFDDLLNYVMHVGQAASLPHGKVVSSPAHSAHLAQHYPHCARRSENRECDLGHIYHRFDPHSLRPDDDRCHRSAR